MTELTDRETTVQSENNEVVISVENVSKKFCRDLKKSLFYGVQDVATEIIGAKERVTFCDSKSFGRFMMSVFNYDEVKH